MPELSRFLGIVIAMYYRDHGPAHFHAITEISRLPSRSSPAALMVIFRTSNGARFGMEELHRVELLDAWSLARTSRPLPRIDPLE
jgi:hypothetical protein